MIILYIDYMKFLKPYQLFESSKEDEAASYILATLYKTVETNDNKTFFHIIEKYKVDLGKLYSEGFQQNIDRIIDMSLLNNLSAKLLQSGAVILNSQELNLLASLFTAFKKKKKKINSTTQLFYRIARRIKRQTKFHLWRDEWFAFMRAINMDHSVGIKQEKKRSSCKVVSLLVGISFTVGFLLVASYFVL